MPTWKNELPKNPTSRGFSIKRTPTQGTIRAILTADRLLVCDTHYWHGRTVPCERVLSDTGSTLDDSLCLPCRDKQGWRTHVYISAFEAKSRDHFIYECTDAAAKPLEEYYQANGTLRGCIINAYRPKGTPNGKVLILTAAADLTKINLPNPPDVIAALCVIWRIPRVGMDKQLAYAGRDNFEIDPATLGKMHTQPDNVESPEVFAARRTTVIDELNQAASGNGKAKRQKVSQ